MLFGSDVYMQRPNGSWTGSVEERRERTEQRYREAGKAIGVRFAERFKRIELLR